LDNYDVVEDYVKATNESKAKFNEETTSGWDVVGDQPVDPYDNVEG
jgi:hypothetical protein